MHLKARFQHLMPAQAVTRMSPEPFGTSSWDLSLHEKPQVLSFSTVLEKDYFFTTALGQLHVGAGFFTFFHK